MRLMMRLRKVIKSFDLPKLFLQFVFGAVFKGRQDFECATSLENFECERC